MKRKRLFLTCMILLLPSLAYLGLRSGHLVKAGTNVWTTNGPYQSGVTVHALTIQPGNASTLYVGTNKGIYKSTNAAESWVPKNSGLTGYGGLVVADIAINPSSTNVMYIGTWGSGVYKSTDGGESWVQANNGLPGRSVQGAIPAFGGEAGAPEVPRLGPSPEFDSHPGADMQTATAKGVPWTPIRKLAINPSNPDMLYAAISGNYGVYRSTDGGNSWTESLTVGSARTVVINPASPNILYAAIDGDGIYKSTDNGENWITVSTVLTRTMALAADPNDGNILYAGTWGNGVYKSIDGGASWNPINSGINDPWVLSVAVAPNASNTVYVGTYDGHVYKSTDGGSSWSEPNPGFADNYNYIQGLAIDPTSSNTLYVGSNWDNGGGVFKSTDGGSTLISKNAGLLNTIVYSIVRDPANPQTIYAGTWGGGVFKSTDGGQNWVEKNGAAPNSLRLPYIYALAISPAAPQIIYAGTAYDNAGVFKSTDYGESWTEMSNGLPGDDKDIFSLAVDPSDPNIVYAGTENNVFKSTNGGTDWTATNGVPQGTQVLALAINPQLPNVLYAGTFGAGVYKSTDSGDNWTAVNNGLDNLYVYDLAIDPTSPDTIYAGTANKVYKSTDGGNNWALASNGLPGVAIRALAIDSTMPSVLYAGTHNQGVYRSPNGGGSWGAFNSGLGNLQIRALTVGSGNPPPIYAGTEGDGVWQYSLVFGYKICLPFIAKNYLPPAPPAAKYAVVIGVADYQHIDDLDYTDDDAQDIYNTLINNCGFQPSDISLLIDSTATKSGIQNAITNWLASREGPGDLVVIFFSGHGGSGPDVPPLGDEVDGYDEYISPYDALTYSWTNDIADDEFNAWLSTLDSTKVVVLIDSCHSGGMIMGAKGITKVGSGKVAVGDGFAKDIDKAGRVVLTASDDDQDSFGFGALQNGVFTYYLVEGLQTPAADTNGNGWVSAEEAYSYLRDRVDNYVLTHVPYPDNNDGEGQDAQLYDGVPGEVDLSTPSVGPVLLYEDNFSDPNSGWPIYEDANVKYEYLDGEYRILVKDSHRWAAASAPGVKFSDFTLEADGRHATGAYGSYGLVFGITDGWEGFYTFEVNADREYSIWKYTADDGWQALKDWTYSSYIKGGRTANHLKVIRDSSRIEAYVNGHYLTTVTDTSFIGSLRVGLVAQAYNVPNVDARFDNFKVFSVGGSTAGAEETAGGADFDTRPEGSDAR